MRRISILGLLALLGACDKDQQCSQVAHDLPAYIAFVGISDADLDTIIVKEFHPQDSFTVPAKLDTIVPATFFHVADTTYQSAGLQAFVTIAPGLDYEIELPSSNKVFRLSELTYPGDSIISWREKTCGGRTFTRTAGSVKVGGQVSSSTIVGINAAYFFLK
jgi:hypothetical protein